MWVSITRGKELVCEGNKVTLPITLDNYHDVIAYAKHLEKECEKLSAHSCLHVTGDDYGNPICGLSGEKI